MPVFTHEIHTREDFGAQFINMAGHQLGQKPVVEQTWRNNNRRFRVSNRSTICTRITGLLKVTWSDILTYLKTAERSATLKRQLHYASRSFPLMLRLSSLDLGKPLTTNSHFISMCSKTFYSLVQYYAPFITRDCRRNPDL